MELRKRKQQIRSQLEAVEPMKKVSPATLLLSNNRKDQQTANTNINSGKNSKKPVIMICGKTTAEWEKRVKKNTEGNAGYHACSLEFKIVRKKSARPPSPSSKVRRIGEKKANSAGNSTVSSPKDQKKKGSVPNTRSSTPYKDMRVRFNSQLVIQGNPPGQKKSDIDLPTKSCLVII